MKTIDLIDRQSALKKMCEACYFHTNPDFVCRKCNVYEILMEMPTIEATTVRHGRWVLDHHGVVVCTICRQPQQIGAKDFCGTCGARMNGGVD